jgi:hypothetical protein
VYSDKQLGGLDIPSEEIEVSVMYLSRIFIPHVSEYLPEWLLVDPVLYRFKAAAYLGQAGEEWSHQAPNRQRHSVICSRDYGHQCQYDVYFVSHGSKAIVGN